MTGEREIGAEGARRLCLAVIGLAVTQFGFSLWMFYPGLVTYDSILQFGEASNGKFTTIHPPLMAAIWRLLLRAGPGSLPMLVMDLGLYWASFAALAVYCVRATGQRRAVVAVLAGLWPLLLSFSGVIWKDVILASAWGLSCALMLLATRRGRRGRFWLLWLAAAFVLLFGTAMRHNAFPAAIVLTVALALLVPARALVRSAIVLGLAIVSVAAVPLSSRLLAATDSRPMENVISFDLTGITYFSGSQAGAPACYSPRLFDSCPLRQFKDAGEARREWRDAILSHPLAYAGHRALVFSMLMRFGCRNCHPYIWEAGNQHLPPGLEYRPNPVRSLFGQVVKAFGHTPLGRPYFWFVAAAGLAGLFWRRRAQGEGLILSLIAASGCIYALTYVLAAVTDEFRYVYWLIYSVVLVGTLALFGPRVPVRELLRWALVPACVLAVLDIGIQLASPTDAIPPSMTTNY